MKPPRFRTTPHRLPRECYRGLVTAAFTACVEDRRPLFTDSEVVAACLERLAVASEKHHCVVLVYRFMPDHAHMILQGTDAGADTWQAMTGFKQRAGFWLSRYRKGFLFQGDYFDHIIRASEDLGAQIRYVMNNPVRRGLVKHWHEYPYTGAIGVDEAVTGDVSTL